MKFHVTVSIETQAGNNFIKSGTFGEKLQTIFQEQKAESVYFMSKHGNRTLTYVTDIVDGAKLPTVAEPWWLLGATHVDVEPCFTPEDMQKAAPEIMAMAKRWS